MDPLSIVTAVLSSALAVQRWIHQKQKKSKVIVELSHTVNRVCEILTPLHPGSVEVRDTGWHSQTSTLCSMPEDVEDFTLDDGVINCLKDTGEALSILREHLVLWREKSLKANILAFINPQTVIGQLQEDGHKLQQKLNLLSFALQVANFRTGQSLHRTLSEALASPQPPTPVDFIVNPDVQTFWRDHIGAHVTCCPEGAFWRAVTNAVENDLNEGIRNALLLRLDEFAVGGITPSSLERFVGSGTIRGCIDELRREQEETETNHETVAPLLVWIDDTPDNNTKEVQDAIDEGITVVSLPSTAAAKAWIDANLDMLREAEAAHCLRFISDNYRPEARGRLGNFLNLSAGETILRYLRGRLFAAPVLIYCGASIVTTRYVLSYERAGSTVEEDVCMTFIRALAQGQIDDNSWEDFDVKQGSYVARSLSQPQNSRTLASPNARGQPSTPLPAPNYATAVPTTGRTAAPRLQPVLDRATFEWSPVSEWVVCELPGEAEGGVESRLSRFSDWSGTVEPLCRIGPDGGSSRSFFSGDGVTNRMNEIREAITHIRLNWRDYNHFMEGLQRMFIDTTGGEKAAPLLHVLPASQEWADRRQEPVENEEYSVLRLYTSERGYQAIFRVLNEAFRKDELTGNQSRLRAAVFLVELLTIELFNYSLNFRPPSSFSGIIYRGLCLTGEHLNEFYALTRRPVKERYWSIPLSIISCTTDLLTAVKFAEKLASTNPNLYPVLWRIHVADLDAELMDIYHQRFPASVVSTICAVRISGLSDYPEEEEVLLRGPFFQLVHVQPQRLVGVEGNHGTVHVMDGVMLNSNRDHPSTMEMAPDVGQRARELFGCLVEIGRTKECMKLANECGLQDDVLQYARIYAEAEGKLARLMQ